MNPSLLARGAEALALTLLVAALVHRAATPPPLVPATAPDSAFSAERAMRHVRAIAQRPHPSGSAEHARVRDYLVGELRARGVEVQVQEAVAIGTRYRMAGRVHNVVARLRGRAAGRRAILLASHYDSQGASPGAGDAGSATAALLETARALRAGPPLAQDVIILLTDAEETGLLGAAAFARQHPWARDVDLILNFEARGTGGRVFMFETGEGNLDAVRMLRGVPDASATSLMVMVYRILPNDTDLSELATLGRPAMNFAFIDGVERYHTARDDIAHLDPRSVQHHGVQALALARAFAGEPLPRPATGDAVFFDAPVLGLIVYPEGWSWWFAALALGLAAAAVLATRMGNDRWLREIAIGAFATMLGLVLAAAVAAALALAIGFMHGRFRWGGAPEWRGVYAAAVVAAAIAAATTVWVIVRRWASARGLHAGAIIMVALLAVATTAFARGASYLFAWPAIFVAASTLGAAYLRSPAIRAVVEWVGIIAVVTMLVPLIYLLGVALGIQFAGAAAAGAFAALAVWLLAPVVERIAIPDAVPAVAARAPSRPPRRWRLPATAAAVALLLAAIGALTVRPSADFPTRASVRHEVWPTGDSAVPPQVTVERDATANGRRSIALRVSPPDSTWILRVRAASGVHAASLDGRAVDGARYRRRPTGWELGFVAPPDTGFLLALTVDPGVPLALDLAAERAGLPDAVKREHGRGGDETPSQQGDLTIVRRRVTIP